MNFDVCETGVVEPAAVLALRIGLAGVINAEEDKVQPHGRDRFEPAVLQDMANDDEQAARLDCLANIVQRAALRG